MAINGADVIREYDTLKTARANRDTTLEVVAPYVDPSRGNPTSTHPTEGEAWMTEVYDSKGIFAADLSAHYIQGQSTSPGKKWFNLKDRNEALNQEDEVKEWFEETRDRMLSRVDRSNFYAHEFQVIKDWYSMGCGGGLVEEQPFDKRIPRYGYRGLNLGFDMIGRFVAGWNSWGDVHQYGVERMWSAGSMVERFGKDNVSEKVKQAYDKGALNEQFKAVHFISPRKDNEYGQGGKKRNMPFKWCWVEYDSKHVCQDGGFDKIPALVPRQNGLFGEPYGRGRADVALNDLITLSTGRRLSFEDWALKIKPITLVRSQVLFGQQNLVPGSFIQANWTSGRPLSDAFFQYDGGGRPEVSQFNVEQLQASIDGAFMVKHLQQLLTLQGTHEQTAYERAQMERQVLRLIAAIYTSFLSQFLQGFIDLLFDQMFKAGEFGPPPDILLQEGGEIDVVFDSPLATTQVSDEIQAMEEFEMKILNHAAQEMQATGKPSPVLDLVDWSRWYATLANKLKVPSGPMRSNREIAMLAESRAEAERNQTINQELAGGAEALGKVAPFLKAVQGEKQAA